MCARVWARHIDISHQSPSPFKSSGVKRFPALGLCCSWVLRMCASCSVPELPQGNFLVLVPSLHGHQALWHIYIYIQMHIRMHIHIHRHTCRHWCTGALMHLCIPTLPTYLARLYAIHTSIHTWCVPTYGLINNQASNQSNEQTFPTHTQRHKYKHTGISFFE